MNNKTLLVIAGAVLAIFGSVLLFKSNKAAPYYVPNARIAPLRSIHLEPPTVEQVKKDISGKTFMIGDKSHKFQGPELNLVTILNSNPEGEIGLAVDVQICGDMTLVQRTGVFTKSYSHENVCGSIRVHYERKNNKWEYKIIENIDMQKTLKPNAKAPPIIRSR